MDLDFKIKLENLHEKKAYASNSPSSSKTAHLCDTVPHGGWTLFAGGGRGHGGGRFHYCGGHISQRGGGGGVCSKHRGHVTYQPQVALSLDVGVALGRQLKHLQSIIVQARDLALEVASLLSTTTDFDEGLAVKDGQLAT